MGDVAGAWLAFHVDLYKQESIVCLIDALNLIVVLP